MSVLNQIHILLIFNAVLISFSVLPMRKYSETNLDIERTKKQASVYSFYEKNSLILQLYAYLNKKEECIPFHTKHFQIKQIGFNKENEYQIKTKITYVPMLGFIDPFICFKPEDIKKTYYIGYKQKGDDFLKISDEQPTYITDFKKCRDQESVHFALKNPSNYFDAEPDADLITIYKYYQLALAVKKTSGMFGSITAQYYLYKITNFRKDSFANTKLICQLPVLEKFNPKEIMAIFFSYLAKSIKVILSNGEVWEIASGKQL